MAVACKLRGSTRAYPTSAPSFWSRAGRLMRFDIIDEPRQLDQTRYRHYRGVIDKIERTTRPDGEQSALLRHDATSFSDSALGITDGFSAVQRCQHEPSFITVDMCARVIQKLHQRSNRVRSELFLIVGARGGVFPNFPL